MRYLRILLSSVFLAGFLAACSLTPGGVQFLSLHFELAEGLVVGGQRVIHQQVFPAEVELRKYFVRVSGRISGATSLPDRLDLEVASEGLDDGNVYDRFKLKVKINADGSFSATGKWKKDIRAGTLQSIEATPVGGDLAGDLAVDVCVHVVKKKTDLNSVAECSGGVSPSGGQFNLVAAQDQNQPGFHELISVTGTFPEDLTPTSGRRLILGLRDVSRPSMVCDGDHPLSGCATVDWDDFGSRRNVTPSGYFTNRLVVDTETGPLELFMTMGLGLESELDDDFALG